MSALIKPPTGAKETHVPAACRTRSNIALRISALVVFSCAVAVVLWINVARVQQIDRLSYFSTEIQTKRHTVGSSIELGPSQHSLILPDRNEESFHWILQTQRMFSRGEWRVRHVDYDNAPLGRDVSYASPYRWWLGLFAWGDHVISARPLELAVERAALWAGPTMQLLWAIGATIVVAWRLGATATILVSLGIVGLFPLAANFYPGLPDHRGLAVSCAFAAVLCIIIGIRYSVKSVPERDETGRGRNAGPRWFTLAGLVGGFGLWVSVSIQVPFIIGICIGGLIIECVIPFLRRSSPATIDARLPWRAWAWSGGAITLLGYLIEYFPSPFEKCDLDSVHPLYGLAWIGSGELLSRARAYFRSRKLPRDFASVIAIVGSIAAIAACPVVARLTGSAGFLTPELSATRLSALPESVSAPSFFAWMFRDGFTAVAWTTIMPLLIVAPCAWWLLRRSTEPTRRAMIAVAMGPVLVAAAFACLRLEWWSALDAALLALAVAATGSINTTSDRTMCWWIISIVGGSAILGLIELIPTSAKPGNLALTRAQAEQWMERDLAHWLQQHSDRNVLALAPPATTTSLCFYGGLRGIGTLSADNQSGMTASIRIATATSDDEAHALIEARGVTHIVLPSWDLFFSQYAQSIFARPESIFISRLINGNVPLWLRPIAYNGTKIAGLEAESVRVFEVVEEQSEPLAISRVAEYWLEVGDLARAAEAERTLRRFPGNLSALVARAHVLRARGETDAFAETLQSVLARLTGGGDRVLPWDRRVSLALLLARTRNIDSARQQLRRCSAGADQVKVRTLSTAALYNLLGLSRALDADIADPALREYALDLLPDDLRAQIRQ